MKLIPPQKITLNSSNVAESDLSEWLSGTTYNVGDQVYVTLAEDGLTEVTPHKIYESLTSSNTGNYPGGDPTNWLDTGATNRWKMFDDYVSSQTENPDSIQVNLTPESYVDTLALFGLAGTEVTVVCSSGGTVVDTQTISLVSENVSNWFDYFFSGFEFTRTAVIAVPGLYSSMTIDVTITYTGDTAKCGHCALGLSQFLGKTQYAPTSSINDYSAKETNDFGETYLNQRAFAKTLSADLYLASGAVDKVINSLTAVRSTPCIWQFNNSGTEYETLVIFGFYKDFDVVLQSFKHSECSIEIEGLI